jgi:hypothetical protein
MFGVCEIEKQTHLNIQNHKHLPDTWFLELGTDSETSDFERVIHRILATI